MNKHTRAFVYGIQEGLDTFMHRGGKYEDYQIRVNLKAYEKLYAYTQLAKGEVSGLGKVVIKGKFIDVVDVVLLKQVGSSATTTLDNKALANFMIQLAKNNQKIESYKLWWHSHNDFGCFWSATDEDNIQQIAKKSMLVSICLNKKGEIVGRIDDKRNNSDVPVCIVPFSQIHMKNKYKAEVFKKVKEEKFEYDYPSKVVWYDKTGKKLKESNDDQLLAAARFDFAE